MFHYDAWGRDAKYNIGCRGAAKQGATKYQSDQSFQ
jgi:hypothetical protein